MALPVYGYPKRGYSSDEIVHILLNPIFNELLSKIHPVSVEHMFHSWLIQHHYQTLMTCVRMILAHGNAQDLDV